MGGSANCVATVSGSGNYSTAVNWTATGGTITQSGVFTPSGPGSGTCTAYSTQDDTKSGTAIINTAAAPISAIVTGVSVMRTPSSINMAQTATCVANVSGTSTYSNSVAWTATGGTITPAGVFMPRDWNRHLHRYIHAGRLQDRNSPSGYRRYGFGDSNRHCGNCQSVTAINTSQTATCSAVSGTGAFATVSHGPQPVEQSHQLEYSLRRHGYWILYSYVRAVRLLECQWPIGYQRHRLWNSNIVRKRNNHRFRNCESEHTGYTVGYVTSTGTTAVTISGASVTGTGFSLSGATYPFTLNPNQTATVVRCL